MSVAEKSKVTKYSKKISYVQVKFYPDLTKFKLDTMDNDHYNLFYRRAYDIAGTSNCGSTCKTNYESFIGYGGEWIYQLALPCSTLDLTQSSSNNQTYSINQSCINANGCGTTTITQN